MESTDDASQHLRAAEQHLEAARAAAVRRRDLRQQQATAAEAGRPTPGQRAADAVASIMGSWRFLIAQSVVLGGWVVLNAIAWGNHWDPYPFILLNLMLSFQAAYAAPVLLMSANRQAAVDRAQAHNDYLVDQRAEAEVEELANLLRAQLAQGKEILNRLAAAPDPGPTRSEA